MARHSRDLLRKVEGNEHTVYRDTVAVHSTLSSRISRFGPGHPARLSSASHPMLWRSVHVVDRPLVSYHFVDCKSAFPPGWKGSQYHKIKNIRESYFSAQHSLSAPMAEVGGRV